MKRFQVWLLLAANFSILEAAQAAPAAILTRVSGRVEVLRGAQKLVGRDGLQLQNGDKISVKGGAATIFTLNSPPKTLQSGSLTIGISTTKSASVSLWKGVYNGLNRGLNRSDRRVALTMRPGEIEPVAPLPALIDSPRPRFEWRSGALNASRYEVIILNGAQQQIWRGQTEKTFIDYPATAPKLSGALSWKVTPLRLEAGVWKPITDWTSRTVAFQIASPQQLQNVRLQLAALNTQSKGLSEADLALARASLWNEQGFNSNALRELEGAGDDETVRALRRDLWLQTGQSWRLKTEPRLTQQPIGSADTQLLKFAPDTAIAVTSLKSYIAPNGRFMLQIPSSFAVSPVELSGNVKLYDFAATPISRLRLSVSLASPADFKTGGSLLSHLSKLVSKNIDFKAGKPVPTTFRGQKALRSHWQSTLAGRPNFGEMVEWREAGFVCVAAWGGDKSNSDLLRQVFSTLRFSPKGQPLQNAEKEVAASTSEKSFVASMEATLAEMRKLNAQQRNLALDTAANAEEITPAEFERLEQSRLATPPDTHERAALSLKASRLAARLSWISSEKKAMAEASQWFERRAKLDAESYAAETAALRSEIKADEAKIAHLLSVTPPLAVSYSYSVALGGLLTVKSMRINQLCSLALMRGDIARLELDYRELAAFNKTQLELTLLSDSGEAMSLEKRRNIANDFDNLAYAAQKRADLDGSRAYYSRAIDWRRSLPLNYAARGLSESLRYRGSLEAELGDNRLARDFYEQALAESDRVKPQLEQEIAAETDEQLRSLKESDWAQSRALIFNNLALIVWTLGDFAASEAYLQKALQAIEPLPTVGFAGSVRASQRASTFNNLSVYYADTGDLTKADNYLSQSIQLYRDWGDDVNLALTLLNSAGLDYERGLNEVALSKVANARTIFVQLQRPKELVQADVFASKLEHKRGNDATALTLASNALSLARTLGDAEWLASAARAVANIHLDSADVPLTAESKTQLTALLDEASRADERAGDLLSRIATLVLRARFQEKSGDLNAALATLKNAITLSEQVRATAGATSNFSEVKTNYQPYELAVHLLVKLNRPEEAFDIMGRARSKKLVDSLSLSALQSNDVVLQKLLDRSAALNQKLLKTRAQLASEVAQPMPKRDTLKISHLRDLIASTQAEFFEVSTQIKSRNPRFEKALSLSPRELKKAQRAIPEGTLLLQYAPLDDGLYIFAVTRDSLQIYAPKVVKADLSAAVRAYRGAIDGDITHLEKGEKPSSIDDANSPLRSASEKLSQWLLEPVQDEIDAARTVAIIPSGELFYVPFHALGQADKNGKWRFLVEEKPIAYLMSGDVLSVATERDESQEGQGVLAMGDPTGANLPAARDEVESIARIFPASRALVGTEASKVTLLQPANLSKRVVHLAAHGVLDSARPDQSFIQLAPNGKDDGKLRVGEIYGLNLNHVDLVTLSACRTAVGEGEPDGTEISSLAQSFSTAGTPSVVASLWNVEDGSTAHLMEKFYSSLTEGTPKGIALQKAQIALLSDAKTRHPVFWAPFELLGDWR